MKRDSFVAAFVANAATAILTKPGITPDIVFKAANDYADEAQKRGYIEQEQDYNSGIAVIKSILSENGKMTRKSLEITIVQQLNCTKRFATDLVETAYINGVIAKEDPEQHYSKIILK